MVFAGFFWRQIFFGSPGPYISHVTFEDLSFVLSFKLIGALHEGLSKTETKITIFMSIVLGEAQSPRVKASQGFYCSGLID